ncbi:Calcineurin-like phosphoesterase [Streptoalloteichus tenebrarius]|uniref:Calcineurin-like phosphoesterase n=1 Tax=Streptoalloteichus tenebrarius (strain ATCC 17920 / DSM 40477 / JCM 4838 / CBS 697.72 / NBRC 16177 / NCIMB 11028 / NRRL B-12390 / A12253. 1 / ISP 5477) TaxID=1933 RepID=A0ABT1HMS7_STRSD|nr:phosphodiester glycosidase family protein [Streptoalloteichus tenebrarius]MCP2256805.1 Calcineurin-like phosphoesterase [Streptoalloteichus tenebrarius]BFF00288.1 phosphodiester glycosidase family protein [Streptoalloteichus tenebrarius]
MSGRLAALVLTVATASALLAGPAGGAEAPLGPRPVEDAPEGSPGERATVLSAPGRFRSAAVEDGIETDRVESSVAPGLTLTQFDQFAARGWARGDALSVDLGEPALHARYLGPHGVSAREPLSEQAASAGAIAGVNGDFFDINATGAPLGVGVSDGRLLHGPAQGHNGVVAVDDHQRLGRVAEIFLHGAITLPDGRELATTNLNSPVVAENGIGLYTSLWGPASRHTAVGEARNTVEIELQDDVVVAVRSRPAEGPIPAGRTVVLARDAGAEALAGVKAGDRVRVRYQPRGDAASVAVGGLQVLVRDGVVQPLDDTAMHPRTAVGFSADGRRMTMVTVDGRQADSRGMTLLELARLMRSLGAHHALNLDGGGSSTLLARQPGDSAVTVHNAPSDGGERPVPNGLGITASGSGRLAGFRVAPAVPGRHAERVLAGLTRRMVAHGHDEVGGPVVTEPRWRVVPSSAASVEGRQETAVFRAGHPGTATVVAGQGRVEGRTELTVLGPPVRVATDAGRVSLSGQGARGRFRVLGHDAEGFGTWVEPGDVALDYDQRVVRISPDRDGFVVEAVTESGATTVTARVGGLVTRFGVTVGTRPHLLSTMDKIGEWLASVHPAVVGARLSTADGRSGDGGAVALDYRLTGTTATRAAYVNAAPALALPEGTQRVGVWTQGDGRGAWLRMTLLDATGTAATVDLARSVDWTGWRYVDAAVPPGLTGAIRLSRIYVVETDRNRQYEGRVVLDDLTAHLAPPLDVPPDPAPHDAAVVTDGDLDARPGALRVAVVSDAQFTADAPDGPLVAQARRTFREALAARPDLVLVNGDLVDRGTAADFALARRVLDEELGDRVPWHYLPGNHETYGPGDTSEFRARFGDTHRVVDLRGTRLVLLDSSLGSLRAGGFDQVRMLRDALDRAAADPGVRALVVTMHHPVDDPGPSDTSELTDPKEGELLTRWLATFRAQTGKPTALVAAHAGLFHASRVDGVPLLINGNSGKAPAAAPGDGGFTGWTLLRVDPADGVRAEFRPHVDRLELTAPERLAAGESGEARAVVTQDGRRVPVAYPVGADWAGSPELHVGPADGASSRHVAAFDPASGRLVALRPGRVEIAVTVNGTRTTRTVEIH